jgi:aspartyl-tRNA(Asn)/glutamyl-tRNA(Gln) amidotransferase subunit C
MEKINKETVDKLATLARLEFDGKEKEEIVHDLNRMLDFVSKLNELDTSGTEPLIYMNEDGNGLREDEVKQEITHEQALSNAPKKDAEYFRVPKVIENK